VEPGRLAEHLLLQLLQLGPRFDAELVDEPAPQPTVGGEGVGLPSGAVERQHQLRPQPLPEGVLGGELLQLGHHLGVAAEGQVGVDPSLSGGQAQLLEPPDGGLQGAQPGQVGEHVAPPQPQGLAERGGGVGRPPVLELGPSPRDELLEAPGVDAVGLDLEHVAGRSPDHRGRRQRPAQAGHVGPDDAHRRLRPLLEPVLGPQRVDQRVGGHHLTRSQGQKGQHGPQLGATQPDRRAVDHHLQGSEHPDAHTRPLTPASLPRTSRERTSVPAGTRRVRPRSPIPGGTGLVSAAGTRRGRVAAAG
jgi:hypothetical protein